MKRIYYITEQFIYMNTGNKEISEDIRKGVDKGQEKLFFTGHVFLNGQYNVNEGKRNCVIGDKIFDNVEISIPTTTPSITF